MNTTDQKQAGEAAPLHTPTPFYSLYQKCGQPPHLLDAANIRVATFNDIHPKANAHRAFIVRACNAYDSDQRKIKALTEALKRTADRLERVLRVQSAGLRPEEIEARISTHPDLCHARKALAKEGQS